MRRLHDFLERFRPAGTPGAAARGGVPADRAAELTAELAGVFGALEPAEAECRAIRDAARHDARDMTQRAKEQAAALIADTQARVEAERASATAGIGERAVAEHTAVVAAAERLAAQIRARAEERLPALVARAVEILKEEPS